MNKKIVLSGYFGFDNLGDEAILYSMVKGIGAIPDVEIVALSSNPEKTAAKFNIKAVDRMKMSAVLREIRNCDLFISGGGSLLQDVTSKRSLIYYLTLLKIAKFFKKKVMIYSQGIGPVNDAKNRAHLTKVFKKLDEINVRDNESKQELIDMGVKNKVSVTADTVFLLDQPEQETGKRILTALDGFCFVEAEANLGLEHKAEADKVFTVGISIRPWKELNHKIVEEIKKTIEQLKITYPKARFVLLPFHHPGDLTLSHQLYNAIEDKENIYLIEAHLNEREMLSVIGHMDVMLSMRLHGLIFAVVAGAYPIGISYDPKIQSLMKELNLPAAIEVEDLNGEILAAQVEAALAEAADLKRDIEDMASLMQKRALENVDMVRRLLQ